MMTVRARLGFLVILIAGALACAPRPGANPPAVGAGGPAPAQADGPAPLAGKNCYLAQLHLHGLSNHNGNALPASMESQTYEAKRNGFDLIWWSDHAEIFEDFWDFHVSFARAFLNDAGNVILAGRLGRQLSGFAVQKSPGARVAVEDSAVTASVRGLPGNDEYRRISLTPISKYGSVRRVQFCRPLTTGLRLEADLGVNGLGPDTYLKFGFDFSWHPGGQHHVIFEAVTGEPAEPVVVGDTVVVRQFVLPPDGPVAFDLLKAVAPLPCGEDNTLSSFTVEIGAKDGAEIALTLGGFRLRCEEPLGITDFGSVRSLAEKYSARFGIASYVGVEASGIHTPTSPHMNGFLPERSADFDGLAIGLTQVRKEWVKEIHRQHGIVSFNHPFGTNRTASLGDHDSEDYDETPLDESPRTLAARGPAATESEFWSVARPLLDGKAFGADILEVGYLYRGAGSLDDHLRLWDLALANGIHLVGDGTSDSHGGVWGPDMLPNPFASWIWSRGVGRDEIIDALSRGHVAFGDPFNWKADFAFLARAGASYGKGGWPGTGDGSGAAATVMMGDTLSVPAGAPVEAWIYMEPGRDDLDVVGVQTKIRQSDEVVQTRQALAGPPDYRFSVAVDESCYVRVEVRGLDGTPLVFSNPIYLFPAASGEGLNRK